MEKVNGGVSKMKKIDFPRGFYSFHSGVPLSHEQINNMIEDCIDDVKSEEDGSYSTRATGNVLIFVEKYNGEIDINVSQGYFTKNIKI